MTKFGESSIKIVFLSQSKRQARQYQLLCEKSGMQGTIVNIKHPGLLGSFICAARWLVSNRACTRGWLEFQQKKDELSGRKSGRLYDALFVFRIYRVLARAMWEVKKNRANVLFLRNGSSYRQAPVVDWCKQKGICLVYMENGFLPNTIQLDGRGVNCHNSMPRELSFYMSYAPRDNMILSKTLVQRKPKVRGPALKAEKLPESYYFVPFQVPTDTQVLLNSPWIRSMDMFYEVLEGGVSSLPNGVKFVVKEHPSSNLRFDKYHHKNDSIIFANTFDTQTLIENSKAVITLNSTVGVEGLLLGKPVITLANACYNVDGLVSHVANIEAFKSILSSPESAIYNELLVKKFLLWLDQVYLIPGRQRELEKEEGVFYKMKERIEEIMSGKYQ